MGCSYSNPFLGRKNPCHDITGHLLPVAAESRGAFSRHRGCFVMVYYRKKLKTYCCLPGRTLELLGLVWIKIVSKTWVMAVRVAFLSHFVLVSHK